MQFAAGEELASDNAERARLRCFRANQAWERGDLDAARRLADEARVLAQAHGDANDLAAAHEALAVVLHLRGAALRAGLERFVMSRHSQSVSAMPCSRCWSRKRFGWRLSRSSRSDSSPRSAPWSHCLVPGFPTSRDVVSMSNSSRHRLVGRVGRYAYAADDELDAAVAELERVYGTHRTRIVSLIVS